MILAAGLTPAWQYVLVFDELRAGEVNRARESRWFASGKAVNVALAAHSLGRPATLVSFIGGATGAALAEDFESTGAAAEWVSCEATTRVCTTLINRGRRETTELVENSSAVKARELGRFAKTFGKQAESADVIVLSGSLPNGTPSAFYGELLVQAAGSPAMSSRDSETRLVLDIRGPELLDCLRFRPFLVKPNREELGATFGRPLDSDEALVAAMRELNAGGATWVLVTEGGERAWLSSATELFRVSPPAGVDVVNPIGCGDSVAAGIAAGLNAGLEIRGCVALGMGAAAANLERMECARFEDARVREFAGGVLFHAG